MKLYDGGRAPNPRRVRVYLAEKGIKIPTEQVDLGAMAHKSAAYAAVNPLQRVPALELDDGTIITESIAICRYFELLHPQPPLFGRARSGPASRSGGDDHGGKSHGPVSATGPRMSRVDKAQLFA